MIMGRMYVVDVVMNTVQDLVKEQFQKRLSGDDGKD
jgi:hypothetical protein